MNFDEAIEEMRALVAAANESSQKMADLEAFMAQNTLSLNEVAQAVRERTEAVGVQKVEEAKADLLAMLRDLEVK